MRRYPVVALGNPTDEDRRKIVYQWAMNGFVHDKKRRTVAEMGELLSVSPQTISKDLRLVRNMVRKRLTSKGGLRDFMVTAIGQSVEMILQDRGRALEQYEKLADAVGDEPVTNKDVGLNMSNFLKAAQQSTEMLGRLLGNVMGKGDTNIIIENVQGDMNVLTMDRVAAMLESKGADSILPSVRYRKKLDALPDGHIIDIESKDPEVS